MVKDVKARLSDGSDAEETVESCSELEKVTITVTSDIIKDKLIGDSDSLAEADQEVPNILIR